MRQFETADVISIANDAEGKHGEEKSECCKVSACIFKGRTECFVEGKYDDVDLKTELESFGVAESATMVHEAARAMLKSDETQEHFED